MPANTPWPATAQLAQLRNSARSPPDPDAPLNLSKQRSPSPQQQQQQPARHPASMMPSFMPYNPDEYIPHKEEDFNAACNSGTHRHDRYQDRESDRNRIEEWVQNREQVWVLKSKTIQDPIAP
ncbi:hypothetical protein EVAR_84685_1 [Eumeta japonica]|uniref:Uncharacterized protein n=1 Tax=Eumeta variegata TaxID=151549 RepID=A0A4C1ZNT2_EUMVA|nr:hypothetical protein EVAR_84685_1 [Eumeta japonica]